MLAKTLMASTALAAGLIAFAVTPSLIEGSARAQQVIKKNPQIQGVKPAPTPKITPIAKAQTMTKIAS